MYDLLILGIVAIAALVYREHSASKERAQLLSRIMSGSLEEYEYFQKQYRKDSKELGKTRKSAEIEDRADDETKEEMALKFKKAKEFMDKSDEDWEGEEIDYEELEKRIIKA